MNTSKSQETSNTVATKSKGLKAVDNKELKKSGFWLNQMFMVLSTVFGVYLAAQSGLEQALKFNDYNQMENNYYLRTSLHDEVQDNLNSVLAYTELLAKNVPKSDMKFYKPNLEKYIWQTMQYSPTTLETPSIFLTQIRRFYSRTDFLIEAALARKISAKHAAKELNKIAEIIAKETLPKLKGSALYLQQELAKNNIEVGSLKELGN